MSAKDAYPRPASAKSGYSAVVQETSAWRTRWEENKGMIMIFFSELFGAAMLTTARLLQNESATGPGMNTLQILFVRFGMTSFFSLLYMWYASVPDSPLGPKELRPLLLLRGTCGFIGVFGFYYSVKYLPVAEAVVITFLVPLLTPWMSSIFLHVPFTTRHIIAGLISLLGVLLIARPFSPDSAPTSSHGTHRLLAIALGLVSDVAAAGAYTSIRVIGHRAHPVLSINYYAMIVTFGSALIILAVPSFSFQLPASAREWFLLVSMGVYGFALQFLMTAGLTADKSSRATNMMYSQIVFAVAMDWAIWGVWPVAWTWVGGAVVVGSTVWVAVQKEKAIVDEERCLLGGGEVGDVEDEVAR